VVTPALNESEEDIVLKGVLRVENLDDPAQYISALFKRTKKEYLENTYGIKDSTDDVDFLEKYAQKTGKLLKKGEPDVTAVAKMILNDWIRGRIPYFIPPPEEPIFPTETGKDASKETQENSSKQKKNSGKLPEIITPKQKISSIRVREEFQDPDKAAHMEDDDIVSSDGDEGEEEEEKDGEVAWEDVVESMGENDKE